MNQRFYSLDVFRGATVALMILVNNPGSWSHIYSPLEHAAWHGCTPTDLVFPFFLFAVGNALAFVLPRLEAAGTPAVLKKVFTRTLIIFAIGLFLNWSPFIKWDGENLVAKLWVDPEPHANTGIRILGVLQRIALSYCFASLIVYFFKLRGAIVWSILLLSGYWLLCFTLGNAADPYSLDGYFGIAVDKAVLGVPHMYKGEGVPFDPEGISSTLTSIVQVMFGYFAGFYIRQKGKTYEMLSNLFVASCILLFIGFLWNLGFPINKKIWTSSYVFYTTGLAIAVLGVLIYSIELKKIHELKWSPRSKPLVYTGVVVLTILLAWAMADVSTNNLISFLIAILVIGFYLWKIAGNSLFRFFDVFGKNPLFIFFLSGFLPRIIGLFRWVDHVDATTGKKSYTNAFGWFYQNTCKPLSETPENGSLLYALSMIIFYWSIVYWMDRRKIYIKV